jgi:CheY-like chemotaxis protein
MIAQERSDGLTRLDGIRVVVVDDAPIVRRFLCAALEEFGAAVTAVETADAALEAVRCRRPDVLLSDLEMPGKGGYWLIGQVRALAPESGGLTPAAALTGLHGPAQRASVLRAGFQDHLEKPIDLHTLVGAVASLALNGREPSVPQPSCSLAAR